MVDYILYMYNTHNDNDNDSNSNNDNKSNEVTVDNGLWYGRCLELSVVW